MKHFLLLMGILVLLGANDAYAVCTEFNKSGCDTDDVCHEEWGIYSERYTECMRRQRAETERIEREAHYPSLLNPQPQNTQIFVLGENNIAPEGLSRSYGIKSIKGIVTTIQQSETTTSQQNQ